MFSKELLLSSFPILFLFLEPTTSFSCYRHQSEICRSSSLSREGNIDPILRKADSSNRGNIRLQTFIGDGDDEELPATITYNTGDFELQELLIDIEDMKVNRVTSRFLNPPKREQMVSFINTIIENKKSPVELSSLGNVSVVAGTWRLGFSTDSAVLGDLPNTAEVIIKIPETPGEYVDYQLKFVEKVFFMNSITAKCKCLADRDPESPTAGYFYLEYDKINFNLMGKEISTDGVFGLLKGGGTGINSVWFDGKIWIDRGYDRNGVEYLNVYVKEDD